MDNASTPATKSDATRALAKYRTAAEMLGLNVHELSVMLTIVEAQTDDLGAAADYYNLSEQTTITVHDAALEHAAKIADAQRVLGL